MSAFTYAGTENLMRWDRRAPDFMEVWYATIGHAASGTALWIRYTITSPKAKHGRPYCELWGFVFRRDSGLVFAAKERYSINRLGTPLGRDDGALVRVGDAWLSEDHLDGELATGTLSFAWSLDFVVAQRCFQHIPAPLRTIAERRVSTVCSPNLAVPFSGTAKIGDEVLDLNGAVGSQSHRWGRRHALAWSWAHCSDFDGASDVVFEGLSARSSLAGVRLPTSTLTYLRYDGNDLAFNDLRASMKAESEFAAPLWTFSACNDRWMITGAAHLSFERAVQVLYMDPDGSPRYCVNSEVGALVLDLYARDGAAWRRQETFASGSNAHVEFGRRTPFAELPLTL